MTDTFLRHRRHDLARLERVNRAPARLDEWECAQMMSAEIRPDVRKPILVRKALEGVRDMVEEVLMEREEMWERRN